ncbi:Ku protein [Streptomyces sp. NPDC126499]
MSTGSVHTAIPIKVYPATESHSNLFRQFHTAHDGRIRYRKVCELDGEQLDQAAEMTRAMRPRWAPSCRQ